MIFSTVAKLQGKDKWPSATASAQTIETVVEGSRGSVRKITFIYRDLRNDIQKAWLKADSTTSLYNIQPGESFEIRYDPKNPTRTYTDETDDFFSDSRAVAWICVVVFVIVVTIINHFKK